MALGSAAAQAADLGGDCCGDLEERIAELEATTARKGNRKVSLKISGWVNEQPLYWDDGTESNVYVGNNDQERTRFKFAGEAKIDADWSAGYTIEIGVRDTRSSRYSQNDDEGGAALGLDIRKSSWFLKSKTYGKLTVGHDGSSTYHLLDDADFTNTRYYADAESITTIGIPGYFLRVDGTTLRTGATTNATWGNILSPGATNTPGNGERPDIIRYDSPEFKGFYVSASWGEDDLWDTALVYQGEIGEFQIAGRIGYAEYTDAPGGTGSGHCTGGSDPAKCTEFGGSATVMHKPTGLYVYGAYGQKNDDTRDLKYAAAVRPFIDDEDQTWYLQAGIERKWHPLGTTTIFGSYRHDDVGGALTSSAVDFDGGAYAGQGYITGLDMGTWSGGVVQNIAAAAMDVYLIYSHVDGEVSTLRTGVPGTLDIDTMQFFQAGARIQF